MIYTVTMNPSLDYRMEVPHVALGITNRSRREEMAPGGKGINVSMVLHRLGVPTTAVGLIAGFIGDAIGKQIEWYGLSTDLVKLKTGMSRINVKLAGAEETEINGAGPTVTDEDVERLAQIISRIQPQDYLVLSGSLPVGQDVNCYYRLAKMVSGKGAKVVVDAAGDLLRHSLAAKPFLVKPNRQELGEFFGEVIDPKNLGNIASLASRLQQEGAQNVLVSLGGDGALLLDSNGRVHVMPAPDGTVVNTVGAGDSMIAGFIAGMESGGDYAYALRLGTACGGATAFSMGLAQPDDIRKVLATLPEELVYTL